MSNEQTTILCIDVLKQLIKELESSTIIQCDINKHYDISDQICGGYLITTRNNSNRRLNINIEYTINSKE